MAMAHGLHRLSHRRCLRGHFAAACPLPYAMLCASGQNTATGYYRQWRDIMKRTAVAVELNQPTAAEQSAYLRTVPVPVHSISFRPVCEGIGAMPDVPAAHLAVSPDMLASSTHYLQVIPPL